MNQTSERSFDKLFKKYQFNHLDFKCRCELLMENLCVQNCGEPSLHCHNKLCNQSNKAHKFCRVIKLQGLTELVQRRILSYKPFLQCLSKIEEEFIEKIRKQHEESFNKIVFQQFEDEQIVALQEIFMRKNIRSIKGNLIDDLYKKLLKQTELQTGYEKKVKNYQDMLNKTLLVMRQLRKKIGNEYVLKSFIQQSKILDKEKRQDYKFILSHLDQPSEVKLLFRASQQKFSATKFHQICDDIPNLLVLIKTEYGKVIGGFNQIGWTNDEQNQFLPDFEKKCFLFSVSLKQKMDLISQIDAIYNSKQQGPTFGGGHDIYISNNCNENNENQSYFPASYNFTSKPYTENQETMKAFLGSSNNHFRVEEYEVFFVKK